MTKEETQRLLDKINKAKIGGEDGAGHNGFGSDLTLSSHVKFGIPSRIPELDMSIGRAGYPAGRIIEFYGLPMSGKAQWIKSKVLTPKGWLNIGDLSVGDVVNTPDGKTAIIDGVFPQGKKELYEISFYDGSKTISCLDHLWKVYSPSWRRKDKGWRVKSLIEIKDRIEQIKQCRKNRYNNVYVPITAPIFHSKKEYAIEPYLLGALLGDGGFTSSVITFTNTNEEIVSFVQNSLKSDYELGRHKGNDIQYSIKRKQYSNKPNYYKIQLRQLGLLGKYSEEKFIPKEYFFGNIDQRQALLQGLMDTDGSAHTNRATFSSKSLNLAQGVQILVRSLGGLATIHKNSREEYSVRIRIRDQKQLFRCSEKRNKVNKKLNNLNNQIKTISYKFSDEAVCISLDNKEKLYITDDYIVTHNTTAALHALAQCQRMGGLAVLIDTELAFDLDRAAQCGVDPSNLVVLEARDIEEIFEKIDIITSEQVPGTPILIAIDSITAVQTRYDAAREIKEGSRVGEHARTIRAGLQRLNQQIGRNQACVIFINHATALIGKAFGKQSDSAGGNAIKFWSSIRVEFAYVGNINEGPAGEDRIRRGQTSNLTIIKNKVNATGAPVIKLELTEEGFDIYEGLWNAYLKMGALEKINNQSYHFLATDTTLGKKDWKKFVNGFEGKDGRVLGVDGFYKHFLTMATNEGFIKAYGQQDDPRNISVIDPKPG